jgi:hypothetical protein
MSDNSTSSSVIHEQMPHRPLMPDPQLNLRRSSLSHQSQSPKQFSDRERINVASEVPCSSSLSALDRHTDLTSFS